MPLTGTKYIPDGAIVTANSTRDPVMDSFGRTRTSLPSVVFEQNFSQAPADPIWEKTAYGSGSLTNTLNSGTTNLNTIGTASGNGYWIQSYQYIRYAPGISTLQRFTFTFAPFTANLTQRVGMFSDQAATGSAPSNIGDGLYLEVVGTTVNLVLRNYVGGTVNEIRVPQNQWSIDHMDGTGPTMGNPSGININWTVPQHFILQFQYLGVGVIRMGFNTQFETVWVHEFVSVNALATPYARTGSFPVRAEIYTTGTIPAAATLQLINMVVLQETDGTRKRGWRYFSANSGTTTSAIGTANALYPLLAVRALLTNDLTKRATIVPVKARITVLTAGTGTTAIQWALVAMPTPMTGATFGIFPAPSSICEIDQGAAEGTAVTGEYLFSGTLPNAVGAYDFDLTQCDDNQIRVGQNAAGSLTTTGINVLALAVGSLQGTTTIAPTLTVSLDWKEIY
jgi:hypothetical protein